jgi:hypothetical protein
LAAKGYTHALIIGFNNTIEIREDKRMFYFGVNAILYNIQQPINAAIPPEERDKRALWRYTINPSAFQRSSSYTRLNPYYGTSYALNKNVYSYTHTTTWSERECLQVACIHDNKSLCSEDELFTGTKPLYLEIYKKAALVNMRYAATHFKDGKTQNVQSQATYDLLMKVPPAK